MKNNFTKVRWRILLLLISVISISSLIMVISKTQKEILDNKKNNKNNINNRTNNPHSSFLQTKIDSEIQNIYEDNEYGDDLEGIITPFLRLQEDEKKDKTQISLFSKIYEKISDAEITANTANLLKDNEDTNKSFFKLNALANLKGGKEKLKSNGNLKDVLKLLLNNPAKSHNARVKAAKLSARLFDIATTYQMTEPDQKNDPKNMDSYIAVPRVKRLYTNDRYIENFRAGNWKPI